MADDYSSLVGKINDLQTEEKRLQLEIPKLMEMQSELVEEVEGINKQIVDGQVALEKVQSDNAKFKKEFIQWRDKELDRVEIDIANLEQTKTEFNNYKNSEKDHLDKRAKALKNSAREQKDTVYQIEETRETVEAERTSQIDLQKQLDDGLRQLKIDRQKIDHRAKATVSHETELKGRGASVKAKETKVIAKLDNATQKLEEATATLKTVKERELDVLAREDAIDKRKADLDEYEASLAKQAIRIRDRERTLASH